MFFFSEKIQIRSENKKQTQFFQIWFFRIDGPNINAENGR